MIQLWKFLCTARSQTRKLPGKLCSGFPVCYYHLSMNIKKSKFSKLSEDSWDIFMMLFKQMLTWLKQTVDNRSDSIQDVQDTRVLSARVFESAVGTGVAVLTGAYRVFLVNNYKEPKTRLLAEVPGLLCDQSNFLSLQSALLTLLYEALYYVELLQFILTLLCTGTEHE